MPNTNYGTGGNSLNAAQGLNAVSALMDGFFGSPELRFQQQKFGLQQDQAAQNAMQFNARQDLGSIIRDGIINKDPKGRVMISREAAGRAAQAGDLPQLTGLIRGINEPAVQDIDNENRLKITLLTAPPLARDFYFADQTFDDPEQRKRFLNLRDFATTQQAIDDNAALQRKLNFEKSLFQVPNVNAGFAQLIDAIITGPGTPEEKAARFQAQKDFARSAGPSGGYSPEQKAAGENQRDVLGLTTPVSPVEGNVAQRLSDMAVAAENAKTGFKLGTYDVNSKEGGMGLRMNQAGLTAQQQLDYPYDQDIRVNAEKSKLDQQGKLAEIVAKAAADQEYFNVSTSVGAQQNDMRLAGMSARDRLAFETNEKIRLEREKAELGIEYPTTDTAYRVRAAKRSGISDLEQYATEVKPLVLPEGGSAVIPQGSYLERRFKPSVDKVALAKQAEDTLTSMTKQELDALPRGQLIRLKQAINAGKSAFPEQIKPDSITGRFPTKEEAPKSGELSYNPKNGILLSTKLDKVDAKVDHEFDKLLDAYDNVTRAIEATEKYPKAFGNQFALAAKIPFFGESAKNSITAKGEAAARSIVFDATSEKKHEIYGAALTGGEQLDANNFLPSGADSAEKVREKMQALQGNLYRVIERRMDTFHPYNQSHFLKSYESGRKMIDPASMTRAQQRNGKTPTPAAAPTQAPTQAPAPAPSPAVAPTPVPAPQRRREGPPNNSGFGVKG